MALGPGSLSSYNVAPGDTGPVDYKRRVAAGLLQQGMTAEPVGHWTQGVARLVQALTGGYILNQANQEDEAEKAGARKIMLELTGGGQPQPSPAIPMAQNPPMAPAPTPAAMSPQPAPQAPAGPLPGSPAMRVAGAFGDVQSGINSGAIDPQGSSNNLGAPPPQVAQALAGPPRQQGLPPTAASMAQPQTVPISPSRPATGPGGVGAPVAEPRGGLTPERRQELLSSLLSNKYGAPYAQPLFQKEIEREAGRVRPMTPQERQLWQVPENMSAGIGADGKPVFSPPQTNVNLNTAESGLKAMVGKGVERYDAANIQAREAQKRIPQWDTLSEAMKGFSPGATAPMVQSAKRYLKDVGLIEGTDVPDAQVFQTVQKQLQIHAQPKGQGAVSNFERELFSSAIPNIGMDPAALTRMITISKKLDEFDIKVARAYRENARSNGGVPNPVTMEDAIDSLGSPLSTADMAYLNRAKDKAGTGGAAAPNPTKPSGPIKIDANGNIIQ